MFDVHTPRSEEELAGVISEAAVAGTPLEVCGYRSKRMIGRPLQTAARVTAKELSGITLYEPTELVISARAGTSLSEIEAVLDTHGQELAFEPVDLARTAGEASLGPSIGGIVATNASGPRRMLRGAARDHLLGVRAVNGAGQTFKSGGRVMKNVTGYDLARGLAGSWGTLAVLTEVTLKVLPKAEASRTLLFLNLPDEAAVAAICAAMATPYEVSGTIHLQKDLVERLTQSDVAHLGQAVTALRIENFSASVDYRAERLHGALRAFGDIYELDHERSLAFWTEVRRLNFLAASDWSLWRLSVAPHQGARVVGAVSAHVDCRAAYEWSGGLIWLEVPPATDAHATDLRRSIAEFGAEAMLVRAPLAARSSVDVFQPLPEVNMTLTRRLKDAFDPQRILNPGRMYAGV